ncbi:MAG: hypothetical protein N2C12_09160, partial [Planctomycetales bacterium]
GNGSCPMTKNSKCLVQFAGSSTYSIDDLNHRGHRGAQRKDYEQSFVVSSVSSIMTITAMKILEYAPMTND